MNSYYKAVLLWLIACSSTSAAVIVDDFSVGPFDLEGAGPGFIQANLDPDHVFLGERRLYRNAPGRFVASESGLSVSGDATRGTAFFLVYGNQPTQFKDLGEGGMDRFRLTFEEIPDDVSGPFYIGVNQDEVLSKDWAVGLALNDLRGGRIIDIPFSKLNKPVSGVFRIHLVAYGVTNNWTLKSVTTAGPPAPGDFDRNGVVNGADLAEFKRVFGRGKLESSRPPGTVLSGFYSADDNLDGRVDGRDFLAWQRAYSLSSTVASVGVPEPKSLMAAIILFGAIGFYRRGDV